MGITPPDVSVVVPVWGAYAGKPLAEALDSLRSQDVPVRILVVDNASAPPVPRPPGAELMRAPSRLSVGAARNLGLEQVDTPYVIFWDADDLMLPGTVRRLRDAIRADAGLLAVAMGILEGDPPVRHRWPRRWARPLARRRRAFALAHAVWSLFPATGATIMRTASVRDAGGYADADSGEDWVLGVSLAFRGRLALDPTPGRLYRRHPSSLWERRRSTRHLLGHAAAVRERIRCDPAVPRGARLLLPVIAALQLGAILVLQPAATALRAAAAGIGRARP